MSPPALIVHGGAWNIPEPLHDASLKGVQHALGLGWEVLVAGGSAEDAVCAAIVSMEDDPAFDAGTGSVLNASGQIEMDACLMRGDDLKAGAVAAIQDVRNPILVARKVMEETEHVLLAGVGAGEFALAHGIERLAPGALETSYERDRLEQLRGREDYSTREPFEVGGSPCDTVGAVAVDRSGRVVAGTSTGGTPGKVAGRVGDSPIPGAGVYASPLGGVSCTGWGEAILRTVMAFRAAHALEAGIDAQAAARVGLEGLLQVPEGRGGLIVADASGRLGWAFNTTQMAYAWRQADGREGSQV